MTQVAALIAVEHDKIGEKRHQIRGLIAQNKVIQVANAMDLL